MFLFFQVSYYCLKCSALSFQLEDKIFVGKSYFILIFYLYNLPGTLLTVTVKGIFAKVFSEFHVLVRRAIV